MTNDSNFLERVMELGIGISVAQQMPNLLSQCMPGSQHNAQTIPPQVPIETQYYIVVNNAQAGPFTEADLLLMVKNNLIKADTLIWKAGMSKWLPANQVAEINKLFILSNL